MKTIKSFLLILTLAVAGLGYANLTSASEDVRKELEAVYAKIDAAIKSRNLKTLESLLAEDYERRTEGQTLNRAQSIARMKESFERVKAVESCKTTINKIQHVEGNEIVDYTQLVKVTVAGADGKDQSIEITQKGRDWWIKDDDGNWISVAGERLE